MTDEHAESGQDARRRAEGHSHGSLAGRAWSREDALRVLEARDRNQFEDPEALWNRIGLSAGATVVDLGAGTGFFAVVAARRVGPTGRVYVVELSKDLVELLRERRDRESLPQLEPVLSTRASIPLASGIADVLLLANVLHDIPTSTLSEGVRLLRPRGLLVNIDWKKETTPRGPPLEIRLSPEEAQRRLAEQGLHAVEQWEFGPWHYGLVLRRP